MEFTWNVDQTISIGAMPVVIVEPYFFTGEDAKQIITALFGSEVDFYDLGPESERQFSKAEPETGEVVTGTGNPYGARVQTLLVINAVDGTIY